MAPQEDNSWDVGDVLSIAAFIVSLPVLAVLGVANLFRNPEAERVKRELAETKALYDTVQAAAATTPLAGVDVSALRSDIVLKACKRAGLVPVAAVVELLLDLVDDLLNDVGLVTLPEIDWSQPLGLEAGAELRNSLRAQKRFYDDFDRRYAAMRMLLEVSLARFVDCLPEAALDETGDEDDDRRPYTDLDVALVDLIEAPAEIVEAIALSFFDSAIIDAELFEPLRKRLDDNMHRASGIPPHARESTRKTLIFPTEATNLSSHEIVELYLGGTSFERLFTHQLSFNIPDQARFEHCHVVGGTGHGKTQLLQLLIYQDLLKAAEDGRSVVVIDSQGDLIRTISHLSLFDPDSPHSLADRLVIVDPNDVEYPICLNMFDFNRERVSRYGAAQREMILTGTIALYEYLFGALLGSELTEKQGVIFKFLARLMMVIPGATIHTLRDVMENGEAFRPAIERLDGITRHFFETQFLRRTFDGTKQQITRRLWSVLSYPTLERIFSHDTNTVDLFEAMNSGKIVLINTAKDLLKEDGSQVLGRFFIALLGQAALERAAIPAADRRPCFVYVDEAHEYFDEQIEDLLNQARKFRVGLTLAHQNLDQLGAKLRATMMASTSIKLAGGVSSKDARTFAEEMRCDADFVHDMRKRGTETEFACWIKNALPHAIKVSIPLGAIDALPSLSDDQYEAVLAQNRARYCRPLAEAIPKAMPQLPSPTPDKPVGPAAAIIEAHDAPPRPPSAAPVPIPPIEAPAEAPERADRQHIYLQNLIRQLAQDRGFLATTEAPVLNGAGRVDVSLERGGMRIAAEVTVTTSAEHELGNVLKCLSAGYDQVLVISSSVRHLGTVERHIVEQLSADQRQQVNFLTPDKLLAHLDSTQPDDTTEKNIRGYRVKVSRRSVPHAEAKSRQETVTKVIAQSVMRLREKK
jgi:hypothetical protein